MPKTGYMISNGKPSRQLNRAQLQPKGPGSLPSRGPQSIDAHRGPYPSFHASTNNSLTLRSGDPKQPLL